METTTQTNKRIFRFDASLLKKSSCDKRIQYISFDGYREPFTYNDTNYGTAFHKFCSTMYESMDEDGKPNFQEAVLAAKEIIGRPCRTRNKKDHLNEVHLLKTCFDFWEHFESSNNRFKLLTNPRARCFKCNGKGFLSILDENNNPTLGQTCSYCKGLGHRKQALVEQSFEIKVRETVDYEIYACGTIDKVGQIINGCYAIGDIKTTSSWNVDTFLAQWRLNPQLKFYIWAIHKLNEMYPNSVYADMCKTKIGAFIDGIFLKSKAETIFKRSDVFLYSDEERHTFSNMLENWITKYELLVQDYLANREIQPTGILNESCYHLFPCQFFNVCGAADCISRNHVLRNNFKQKHYDPLNFGAAESEE